MKKIAVISLLCIYALATMGFTLKEFYCCGKLKHISLAVEAPAAEKCSMGDSNSDKCCKNNYHVLKVKDNHVTAAQTILPGSMVAVGDACIPACQEVPGLLIKENITYQSHAPPLYNGVPVYLSHCVFRI